MSGRSVIVAAFAAAAALLAISCARDRADQPDIGVVLRSNEDQLSSSARKAMSVAAAGKARLVFTTSYMRVVEQSSSIESFLDAGKKALVIDAVDSLSARSAIAGAKAKGVPLVFMGCLPSEEAMLSWDKVFYVGSRDAEAGTIMGELLAEHAKSTPSSDRNGDGKLQYISFTGDSGMQKNPDRLAGIDAALEDSGFGAKRLLVASTDGSLADARYKASLALEQFGAQIEAIACADWTIAQGVIEECEKAGRLKGAASSAVVTALGSASSSELKAALASGKIIGAAALDAEAIGKAALSLALILAEGKDPSKSGHQLSDVKYLWIPYTKVTRAAP